jgi:SAM-dependent methyltransferase
MTDISALLASYPRVRPPLPPAAARLYVEEYKLNRGINGGLLYRITAWLESWMHHRVASCDAGATLLEIGAGTLNHRRFEERTSAYDIVEPFSALYAGNLEIARVDHIYASIHDVPVMNRYDRIVSVAVLEHVEDLPDLIATSALRLADGGVFQAGIPAEGGMIWGLAWRATTGVAYRLRTGLPYTPVMGHEHINNADEIVAIVCHFFADVKISWFPLPTKHFAFYGYLEARLPRLDRCGRATS